MPDHRDLFCAVDLEIAVLGAILMSNAAFQHCNGLRAAHFFEPIHARIYEAIAVAIEKGEPATPMMVNRAMPSDLDVAGVPIGQYLARLVAESTGVLTVPQYAAQIIDLYRIREKAAIHNDMIKALQDGVLPRVALAEAYGREDSLRLDHDPKQRMETIEQSAAIFMDEMNEAMQNNSPTVMSALADLDEAMGGLMAGELVVMAGRPGMGKTSVAFSIARQTARQGHGVVGFSLEMPRGQTMARMHTDALYTSPLGDRLEYERVAYRKDIKPYEFDRLITAQRSFAGTPMMIDYSPRLTVGEISVRTRAAAAVLQAKYGAHLRLVVIDYLKHVQASERYRGQRVYEVGEITAGLKQLAKDMDCTVLLLAQLSREVERREDKRPVLADLRESGDIEADADTVLFLYRADYYGSGRKNELEINLAKHRMGRTTTVSVEFDLGCSAVRSIERFPG